VSHYVEFNLLRLDSIGCRSHQVLGLTYAPFSHIDSTLICIAVYPRHFLINPSAIDNATRGLINLGQLPVTCGLFFSLGHSTIVVIVASLFQQHRTVR
jgi:hypothetical protein